MDAPVFQPTNFNNSLQMFTENSYPVNELKYLHAYMPYLSIITKLTLKLLLRNWKENSRSKKKDLLRSVTQITMHLLKVKDR